MSKKNKAAVCYTLDKDLIKDIEKISETESIETGMPRSNSAIVNRLLREKIKENESKKKA